MSEELRQRVVQWATNYNEMDCNRVRDAKPLMDDLLRRNEQLERLLRVVAWEDLDADAADAVTVLEVVVKEAQQLVHPSTAWETGHD